VGRPAGAALGSVRRSGDRPFRPPLAQIGFEDEHRGRHRRRPRRGLTRVSAPRALGTRGPSSDLDRGIGWSSITMPRSASTARRTGSTWDDSITAPARPTSLGRSASSRGSARRSWSLGELGAAQLQSKNRVPPGWRRRSRCRAGRCPRTPRSTSPTSQSGLVSDGNPRRARRGTKHREKTAARQSAFVDTDPVKVDSSKSEPEEIRALLYARRGRAIAAGRPDQLRLHHRDRSSE